MQSVLNISIQESGQPVFIPNSVVVQSGGSLTIAYKVNGAPDSLVVVVQGIKSAGESPVLDTYSGITDTTRTVSLTDDYDSFMVTATWTGGSSSVSVGVTVSSTGSGNTFKGGIAPFPRSGIGSPEGVLSAPIGTLYMNLSGGTSTTLYVKTSGSGNTGWTAK